MSAVSKKAVRRARAKPPPAPEPSPKRGRGRPKGNRDKDILRVAAKLFFERGFHAISIDEIGEATGISGPAIYRHFKSKDDILLALVDENADRSEADVRAVHQEGGTPAEMLEHLVQRQIHQAREIAPLMMVASQELRALPPEYRQRVWRRERINREEWAHLLSLLRTDLQEAEIRAIVVAIKQVLYGLVTQNTGLAADHLEKLGTALVLAMSRAKV